MQSTFRNDKYNPLVYQAKKAKLTTLDICRILEITPLTWRTWIKTPGLIRLNHLIMLSGLFGIPLLELIDLIIRNKPQIKKGDQWYFEEIRNKHE